MIARGGSVPVHSKCGRAPLATILVLDNHKRKRKNTYAVAALIQCSRCIAGRERSRLATCASHRFAAAAADCVHAAAGAFAAGLAAVLGAVVLVSLGNCLIQL
jgi:hypothetical protein